jgi:hypothetical protein
MLRLTHSLVTTHTLDPAMSLTWTSLGSRSGAQGPPCPRWGHGAVAVTSNHAVVHGGLAEGELFDDLYVFEASSGRWAKTEAAGEAPSARWGQSLLVVAPFQVLVLGGREGSKPLQLSEYFVLNLEKMKWTRFDVPELETVRPSSNLRWWSSASPEERGILQTPGTTATGCPKNRYAHSAVFRRETRQIITFGGHGGRSRYYNDVGVLQLTGGRGASARIRHALRAGGPILLDDEPTEPPYSPAEARIDAGKLAQAEVAGSWIPVEVRGRAPARRSGHGCSLIGDTMFVLGGFTGKELLSDLWALHLGTLTWSQCRVGGVSLPPLTGHSCNVIPDTSSLVIFGGSCSPSRLSLATFVLDTGLMVAAPVTPSLSPQARFWHRCTPLIGSSGKMSLLLFGGVGERGHALGDVHKLDLSQFRRSLLLTSLSTLGITPPEGLIAACKVEALTKPSASRPKHASSTSGSSEAATISDDDDGLVRVSDQAEPTRQATAPAMAVGMGGLGRLGEEAATTTDGGSVVSAAADARSSHPSESTLPPSRVDDSIYEASESHALTGSSLSSGARRRRRGRRGGNSVRGRPGPPPYEYLPPPGSMPREYGWEGRGGPPIVALPANQRFQVVGTDAYGRPLLAAVDAHWAPPPVVPGDGYPYLGAEGGGHHRRDQRRAAASSSRPLDPREVYMGERRGSVSLEETDMDESVVTLSGVSQDPFGYAAPSSWHDRMDAVPRHPPQRGREPPVDSAPAPLGWAGPKVSMDRTVYRPEVELAPDFPRSSSGQRVPPRRTETYYSAPPPPLPPSSSSQQQPLGRALHPTSVSSEVWAPPAVVHSPPLHDVWGSSSPEPPSGPLVLGGGEHATGGDPSSTALGGIDVALALELLGPS